ncbi:tail protein [Bacillus phage Flapjack]|uniref:Tail protein n=1 Tax=Bacillus phage Flapjack TaxID=1983465 RepID=A0A1X9SFW2_9CAUD|nr:tail protein [Bacillus phage Flapjack]
MADTLDLSKAPYYDRFKADSGRSKVLFRADKALQQAELNELQSIYNFHIKRMGDSIFADGAIQGGMAFVFNYKNNDKEQGIESITIQKGFVYLGGQIRAVDEQTIPFTGKGKEVIGVELAQKIITFNEDPTLLDPTQDVANYLSEGADRLEEKVLITYNKDSVPSIYQFEDGALFIEPDRPEFSFINDVLAQRTDEESGSYQVEGFNMWIDKGLTGDTITLVIDGGVAYVKGYRISKPTSTRIQLPKVTASNSIYQETSTYDNAKQKVTVNSAFVKQVKLVLGRADSPSGMTVSRGGTADGRDSLPTQYTNVDATTMKVFTDSPAYTYKQGDDYRVVQDSGITYIDWNTGLNGKEPTPNTTYKVTFEYERVMKEGTDYKVVNTPNESGIGAVTEVSFAGLGGAKPKDKGVVRVDYDYYLSREDIVTLDVKGNFTVTQGQPDREGEARIPVSIDPLTFKVGNVHLYPFSDKAIAKNTGVTRLRMEDLQVMKTRLENVEYNQAILMLEKQAGKSQDPLSMRGVFADAFTDFSRIDPQETNVSFSFDDAHITLSTSTPDNQKVKPKFMENESVAKSWGRLVTAPFKENVEINQPLATEAWNVNPYMVFNKQGVLKLTPEADNWIDEKRVTLYEEDFVTTQINRWWAHAGEAVWGTLNDYNQWLVDNTSLIGGAEWNEASLGWSKTDKAEGVMWSSAQNTRNEVIEYMRQIEINFTATNLKPMSNNLYVMFDGVRVNCTPTGSTQAGTAGTINANSQGIATGKFMIPQNIRTGTREVTLQNDDNKAITTFSAQGTAKITTDTITRTHVTFQLYDPLAQSFALTQPRVISSVGVYFASKSAKDNIIMQVRGISDGGLPNRTVYAERVLTPADIVTSEDGSKETKIGLDDPLMVEAGQSYCIVFITDSADYTMFCATWGKDTIGATKQTVVTQPYVNGVLFSSSNAVSWTVHQETDMKFKIYTAEFAEEGIIEFDTMRNIDSNGILLMASFLTPENTGCKWEVKIVDQSNVNTVTIDSVPWMPLANYAGVQTPFVVGLAKLRATFKSNRYISPMLALDDLLFVNFVSATSGKYTTKTIDQTDAPFDTITMAYSEAKPAGTRVKPQYSLNGGQTWIDFKVTPTSVKESQEFNRITYAEKVSSAATNKSVKYRLILEGDNRFLRPRVKKLTAVTKQTVY